MNVSNDSHSGQDPMDLTLPLWRRTQLRLQRMATFTPIVGPWDPDWDIPGGGDTKWEEFLRDLAAGIVGEATYNLIESLFSTPYAGTIYRAVSVCETDADGEPISEAVEVPIPPASAPEAQLTRLDAIVELLQAHKNFKQPTCELPPPCLEGDFRTISFRSSETSPYGKSALRKRFRYRSLSGLGLGAVVDHWKNFTWQSGSVIVSHKGHSWGKEETKLYTTGARYVIPKPSAG